jgi:uracil-DNA glycosylase
VTVPREFVELARFIALHRDAARWDLLYRTLYRIARLGERQLLKIEIDPDIRQLVVMQKALKRDIHKMHAFVRFRKIVGETEQYVAWHRPDHLIVEHVGPWFAKRFGAMHWAILTPDRSAYWDTQTLRFGPGVGRSEAPSEDGLEELWRTYYANIFNPARVNVAAMKKELPVRHWPTLPEADLIPALLLEASAKEQTMRNANPPSAQEFVPQDHSLRTLASAIHHCKGCDLYREATQAVFGEGKKKARVMLVGEQPGDQEDLQGKPFVGPAGKLLDRALIDAGIDRSTVYVTNAVKHFKFEERGKRRIHKKPKASEVAACRPWLTAEIEEVNPEVIVALGATAALSVGGREFAIQKERGHLLALAGRQMLVTVHPSFLLRLPDADREVEFSRFVSDLRLLELARPRTSSV